MKADGLASKIAFAARVITAWSCDWVRAVAISVSDCPGLTVICVAADPAPSGLLTEAAEAAALAVS
jgi:hypothetical protein